MKLFTGEITIEVLDSLLILPNYPMKNILLLAALLLGVVAAEAQTSQEPMNTKEAKKAMRKKRRQNGPEVYKGSVAEQRRIVTDAPGSQRDEEAADAKAEKKAAKRNKN